MGDKMIDERKLNHKLAEWAGFTMGDNWGWRGWNYPDGSWERHPPHFDSFLDACFEWLVPKSRMDTLWVINNLGSPTPKIEYCFGYTRGENNDLVCWDRDLPKEDCLSPIAETPAFAICLAIEKLIDSEVAKSQRWED